jgi:hypothetical protein
MEFWAFHGHRNSRYRPALRQRAARLNDPKGDWK